MTLEHKFSSREHLLSVACLYDAETQKVSYQGSNFAKKIDVPGNTVDWYGDMPSAAALLGGGPNRSFVRFSCILSRQKRATVAITRCLDDVMEETSRSTVSMYIARTSKSDSEEEDGDRTERRSRQRKELRKACRKGKIPNA